MTTGATPRYGFTFPYGDDPLTNGDDLWQVFAKQVDDLLWSWQQGMQRVTATAIEKGGFTSPQGYADVTGYDGTWSATGTNEPASSDTALGKLFIPHTALWEVEVSLRVSGSASAALTNLAIRWMASSATQPTWTGRTISVPPRGGSYAGVQLNSVLTVPFPKDNWLHLAIDAVGAPVPIDAVWIRIAGPMGGMITD